MKKFLFILATALLSLPLAQAQQADNYPPNNQNVTITSTNLPIVWIEVNGAMILRDERITAHMKIIHNGDGQLNYADTVAHPGQNIDYEGYIGIRYRGNSSFYRSRKPYSFRPLTAPLEDGGEKKKVKILGMGKDNNWALLAPYVDRSMIHDLIAFELARPWMEYSPQGRFCEVYLDGIYYGVYILTEVVSKGKHRLNLDDPGEDGDELTGGYIMEIDRYQDNPYISSFHPVSNEGKPYLTKYIFMQYKSPDREDITPEQVSYINGQIKAMETAFASENYLDPETGYRKYIDVQNFIDYQLAEELGHNVDAYRLSGKFFKRRDSQDPRFKMVIWDMDLAYGVPNYHQAWRTDLWSYQLNDTLAAHNESYLIPFWWYKLNSDPDYTAQLKARWAQYRRSNVRLDRVMGLIDSLTTVLKQNGAVDRNSRAWPRWGQTVTPNYHTATSYDDEIAYLRQWITARIAWMDSQLGFDPNAVLRGDVNADGEVTIDDVTSLIDYLLGIETVIDEEAADVDENGGVDIDDVTQLIDLLLGGF